MIKNNGYIMIYCRFYNSKTTLKTRKNCESERFKTVKNIKQVNEKFSYKLIENFNTGKLAFPGVSN